MGWKIHVAFVVLAIVGFGLVPAVDAHVGGSWRARDTPSTSAVYPAGFSTATHTLTGAVYGIDFQWSGGGGFIGIVTLRIFNPHTGQDIHAAVFPAFEDVTTATWIPCPFPNSGGTLFNVIPGYSLMAPQLRLGPGAPGGGGEWRVSFCNDSSVPDAGNPVANDPLYFKAFSDFTGIYTVTPIVGEFFLDLHVRGLDSA